jgi:DNA-binding transcriptional ArsR family regulator
MDYSVNQQQILWRALFHPTRRQIVRLLKEKPRTTGELSNFFDVSRYAVMKHLRVLEQADLIDVRREGRLRWNVLNQERLQDMPADYLDSFSPSQQDEQEVEGEAILREMPAGVIALDYDVRLPAAASQIYEAFLNHIDRWWPGDNRPGENESGGKMILEPFVGGRFYQAFDDNGTGELLGFVTRLQPNEEIRILGPMDSENITATSTVHIRLREEGDETEICHTHRTVGEVQTTLLPTLSSHWRERLDEHLRAFVTDRNDVK